MYRVNRDGNAQTAFGYLGIREGQLSRPAGILLDDRQPLWNFELAGWIDYLYEMAQMFQINSSEVMCL